VLALIPVLPLQIVTFAFWAAYRLLGFSACYAFVAKVYDSSIAPAEITHAVMPHTRRDTQRDTQVWRYPFWHPQRLDPIQHRHHQLFSGTSG